MYRNIPEQLKQIPNWVCSKNGSKCPFNARMDAPASTAIPSTWSDFSSAEYSVMSKRYDGIGFVFNGNGIVGIDIDDGWDEWGLPTDKATDIILRCNSYTEVSRSGRGFHILIKGQLPFAGRNNHAGCEIYQQGRYFIITGRSIISVMREDQDAIDYVVERYFPEMVRDGGDRRGIRFYEPVWDRAGKTVPLDPRYPDIANGSRNQSLTSVGGTMRTAGYGKRDIYRKLLLINKTACKPPLREAEIRQIANSVCRYRREP